PGHADGRVFSGHGSMKHDLARTVLAWLDPQRKTEWRRASELAGPFADEGVITAELNSLACLALNRPVIARRLKVLERKRRDWLGRKRRCCDRCGAKPLLCRFADLWQIGFLLAHSAQQFAVPGFLVAFI